MPHKRVPELLSEALAAGVPCLLTPRLAPTFRGLALYAGPGEVTGLLRRLATTPSVCREIEKTILEQVGIQAPEAPVDAADAEEREP